MIWWSGARYLLGGLSTQKKARLDPGLAEVVEAAGGITLEGYQKANAARAELGIHMRRFMQKYDLLVTPTLPIAAFEAGKLAPANGAVGGWTEWTPFSFPFNLTQQPAASVPCGFTQAGLPVGLHIVGRMFDEASVLRAAYAYEQAHEWVTRRPVL